MSAFVPRTLEDLRHEFPPDLDHLSATGINMAMRCLEQWRQVYVKGRRVPPNLSRIGGRADHAAIELSMAQKVTTAVDLPVPVVQEKFLATVEAAVEEVGGLGEIEAATTKEYDTLRVQGQELVGEYHRAVSPTVQPIAVEEWFEVDVPSLPVKLIGRIDLETGTEIIDRKRTGRMPSKPKPEWAMQGRIYQLVRPKPFNWHVSVPHARTPNISTHLTQEPVEPERTAAELQRIALMIGSCYQQFGPDEPWPTTGATSDWACNYCGFRPECPHWSEA